MDGVGGQYAPVGIWETRVLKCEPGTGQATKVRHRQGNLGSKPDKARWEEKEKTVGKESVVIVCLSFSLSLKDQCV